MGAKVLHTITKFFRGFLDAIENSKISRAIRKGLITAIPVLMIGSIALILLSLPVAAYQDFLSSPAGTVLYQILSLVHSAAFDFLAIVFLITISYSYAQLCSNRMSMRIGVPVIALCCFMIMSGAGTESFSLSNFGVNGLFIAILTAIFASVLFIKLASVPKLTPQIYADGTDHDFNAVFSMILPGAFVLLVFASFNYVLVNILGVGNLPAFLADTMITLFTGLGNGLLSGILFVFFLGTFWFFGIHGGNVMDSVSQQYFAGNVDINIANISAGLAPAEILSKTFFDVFVFMGGCGTILCLVIAIFLFSRRRSVKDIAKMGIGPTIFNINEFVIFGLPVVLNPVFFIPFVATPIVITVISYFAVYLGFVPYVTQTVEWTTPAILSGYVATGSVAGSLLQIVNIAVGVLIYRPFIKLYEKKQIVNMKRDVLELTGILADAEKENKPSWLLNRNDHLGSVAKMLVTDLRHAIKKHKLTMHYQPQVKSTGECFGAEALLRWEHEIAGFVAPPLIIELAREADFLSELEQEILGMACDGLRGFDEKLDADFKLSFNITPDTLKASNFFEMLQTAVQKSSVNPRNLWIEVTEQAVLADTPELARTIELLRQTGYKLSLDDFGMGHTSLLYLQNNHFDQVKLDGSIVRDMLQNERSCDIISSIVNLGKSLHFSVLAEYVEVPEQRDKLLELGCDEFQGYLFSKPLPQDELVKLVKQWRERLGKA
ncbi:diguanylate phosphodiesterase [Christensenellaceae bacterium]|nr:diguanylate phosphodiesterase [Christensenellaceae bacterium]